MARRCEPPKSQPVKSHNRAKPRRKAKIRAGTVYWVVRSERTGYTTGTKHRTYTAAIRARRQADLKSFRAGQGRPWNVEKVTA